MRVLTIAAVMTALLAGCGGDDDSDSSCGETSGEEAASVSLPDDIPDIVCDSVEDATEALEAAGYTMRTVRLDGEDLAATADFVENRVNVAVETQGDTSVVTAILSLG